MVSSSFDPFLPTAAELAGDAPSDELHNDQPSERQAWGAKSTRQHAQASTSSTHRVLCATLQSRPQPDAACSAVQKRLTLASPRPPLKRCRGRTRRARSESACQQVRPLEAALREARTGTGSDWACKVRVERAHELGKRGPARGTIFGPLLPSEKGGEEVVRGVGVRALAEEIAQSGDELPPRADDVEPARDEADQLFAQGTTSARIRHRIPRQLERVVEGHKE
eukprot:scaffold8356_cov215-Isochrysis_galbana.AAC.2